MAKAKVVKKSASKAKAAEKKPRAKAKSATKSVKPAMTTE